MSLSARDKRGYKNLMRLKIWIYDARAAGQEEG